MLARLLCRLGFHGHPRSQGVVGYCPRGCGDLLRSVTGARGGWVRYVRAQGFRGAAVPDPIFLSGDAVPDYLKGVELMTAGMQWQASTGPVTITLQHIADAIVACNDDPHFQPPRIKLGHTSAINGDHPDHDPFAALGDAEPAFGVFGKLDANNDGAVLIGDVDKILTWLALSAPATYPNRSAEATWAVESADFDVQTAGGKRYSMVVTAISFLGVYAPAISDLEDLSALIMNGPSAIAATAATPPVAAATSPPVAASISEDEVRQRFNWEWAMDPENELDTYWWWAREVRVTNGEVIADDDEGHLFQVPFTETDGVITFGEPEQVRKTYIPMAANAQVACFARPSKPQRPPVAAGSNPVASARPEPEGVNMDDDVRAFLVAQGFDPETVTEDQINAASVFVAAAALNAPATPAATTEPEADDETADEPTADATSDEPAAERVPVAASTPDPITAAKDAAFARLSAEVAELRAERERSSTEAAAKRRDDQISAALSTGRITPAERETYRALLDVDEDRAGALLSALPADRVPLAARAQVPDPEADSLPAGQPLPDNVSLLNPSERAALAARRAV